MPEQTLPTSGLQVARAPVDRWGVALLTTLAILSAGAVAFASLRHTGSLAFPIDDGYIYSNYVLSASQGHPFTYNLGETSGGITGLGWYLLCVLFYGLLSPFHSLLGILAPHIVSGDPEVSNLAGHLYLAAYLPGVLCLIAGALGVRRLALLVLPNYTNSQMHSAFCWLLGAIAASDLGLLWGAMSGLEAALSASLAVWSVCVLISDVHKGRLRWSLLLVALLTWARPDLLAISAACVLWLLLRSVALKVNLQQSLRQAAVLLTACLLGLGLMSLIYYLGWGEPLPSSFYAKVGGLRLGERLVSAPKELLLAGRFLPFLVAAAALLGGLIGCLKPRAVSRQDDLSSEFRLSALLLLIACTSYTAAIMATLPWFGQEDRYLLPIHPFMIVLVGLLTWAFVRHIPIGAQSYRSTLIRAAALGVALLLASADYLWATRDYAVEVRNIADAHIEPALWLAKNTPANALVASEPIGAVRLFSRRRTIDLVGLTTPITLGTYRNWPVAWRTLKHTGASYLLYYPAWFDGGKPPPWALERARFDIPDNKIAGDKVIAIYELDWTRYTVP